MINKITRLLFAILVMFLGLSSFVSASQDKYIYYYSEGCPHCAVLDEFLTEHDLYNRYDIVKKEIRFNQDNFSEYSEYCDELNADLSVPFLLIQKDGNTNPNSCSYLIGDKPIINFFEAKMLGKQPDFMPIPGPTETVDGQGEKQPIKFTGDWKFFMIMLPAALSDSINPCAFAVMLILLSAILTRQKSYKKMFFAGIMFILAIFLSYSLMGFGLYQAFKIGKNLLILKWVIGILAILIGLANLKDFFWYGKGFVMEVPFGWRPKMIKIINKVASPLGAFVIGLLVSLFLLPCTAGPYLVIVGYMASTSQTFDWTAMFFILLYNLIFIIPMIGIILLVGFGFKSIEDLAKYKEKNTKLIHLIVGLLMLALGIYVIISSTGPYPLLSF